MRLAAALALALVALAAPALAARGDPKTVLDAAKEIPEISKTLQKIIDIGLAKQFQKPRLAVTLFVPTNDAYDKVMTLLGNNPAIVSNASLITQAMLYHIVNHPVKTSQLPAGSSKQGTSLFGQKVTLTRAGDSVRFGGYNVVRPDVKAGRSYINVIDGFVIPPALVPTVLEIQRATRGEKALAESVALAAKVMDAQAKGRALLEGPAAPAAHETSSPATVVALKPAGEAKAAKATASAKRLEKEALAPADEQHGVKAASAAAKGHSIKATTKHDGAKHEVKAASAGAEGRSTKATTKHASKHDGAKHEVKAASASAKGHGVKATTMAPAAKHDAKHEIKAASAPHTKARIPQAPAKHDIKAASAAAPAKGHHIAEVHTKGVRGKARALLQAAADVLAPFKAAAAALKLQRREDKEARFPGDAKAAKGAAPGALPAAKASPAGAKAAAPAAHADAAKAALKLQRREEKEARFPGDAKAAKAPTKGAGTVAAAAAAPAAKPTAAKAAHAPSAGSIKAASATKQQRREEKEARFPGDAKAAGRALLAAPGAAAPAKPAPAVTKAQAAAAEAKALKARWAAKKEADFPREAVDKEDMRERAAAARAEKARAAKKHTAELKAAAAKKAAALNKQ